ncbi:MAG: NAD-dependent deacylase [Pseudomonas sp.]|jgi:NAD-dependent deacetylase|nr:NAD-dependent deacylase [Pseudomonas sp.]
MQEKLFHIPIELVNALRTAQHVVVFTGAGVSAESGVSTFRDALTGLWAHFDPMQLATPEAFLADPELVWGWYEWRRQLLLKAQPNSAHYALVELAQRVPKLTVITQNVDDLHERAGSREVLHLHGSIFNPRCFNCARPHALARVEMSHAQALPVPLCHHCNGLIRPGVVWFGEALPQTEMDAAFMAAENCDVLLSVGTSGVVQPAAQIPYLALRNGAWVVHINPDPVACQHRHALSLVGSAGQILPLLVQNLA